jgi:hypothetical protein
MKTLPCGRGSQPSKPGWIGKRSRVIDPLKRRAILRYFSVPIQRVRHAVRVIAGLLANLAFCGISCACEGDVQQWSRDYLVLKTVHGHFDGGAWTADVDRWGGPKHLLMQCLAQAAQAQAVTKFVLLQWMGVPDEARTAGPTQTWVYHWRGRHDRLLFTLFNGKVTEAKWDLALE